MNGYDQKTAVYLNALKKTVTISKLANGSEITICELVFL
jgi:hypothetical protein